MKLNRFFKIFIVALMFTSLIIGCTPAKRPIVQKPTTPNRIEGDRNYSLNGVDNIRRKPTPDQTIPRQRVEDRIAKEVNKIEHVKNATVLINNNTAYVGIDLAPNIENTKTNEIKNHIINRVKGIEPMIKTVYVSADVDIVGRLRGYAKDIRSGKPISGMINEIEEMFRRPIPRS